MGDISAHKRTRYIGGIDIIEDHQIRGWVRPHAGHVEVSNFKLFDSRNGEYAEINVSLDGERRDIEGVNGVHPMKFTVRVKKEINIKDVLNSDLVLTYEERSQSYEFHIWRVLKVLHDLSVLSNGEIKYIIDQLDRKYRSHIHEKENSGINYGFGCMSPDREAICGRNGHLFLYTGSNDVHEMYNLTDVSKFVAGWTRVVAGRSQEIQNDGRKFLQVLIPEKSSVLHRFSPLGNIGPSNLMLDIVNGINSAPKLGRDTTLMAFSDVENEVDLDRYFRRTDTHLTVDGAKYLLNQICRSLKLQLGRFEEFGSFVKTKGDLGLKFNGDFEEILWNIDNIWLNGKELSPILVERNDPEFGHKGIRRVWTCRDAKFNIKVVVFGNSFFERGGVASNLSWWFSRVFKEFHFLWDPNMEMDYVRKVQPDVVICQTVERFLQMVPEY